MAEIKGKFITLTGYLMGLYAAYRQQADDKLFAEIGRHWNELGAEDWYDTRYFDLFIRTYATASPTGEQAIITLGRHVYPTIRETVGLPAHLKTPLDFIQYETESFLRDHRGPEVVPRRFIQLKAGDVIVEANAPGYPSKVYAGVYLGILDLCRVVGGEVEQLQSQEQGDPTSEFRILW